MGVRLLPIVLVLAACGGRAVGPADRLVLHEDGVESAYPRLSRDGTRVLFQSNRSGHWQLRVMDLATGFAWPLMITPSNETLPDWSPDNAQVAFVSDRDGQHEVYVVDADGTHARRITTNPGDDIHPYWSPDGRALLWSSARPTPEANLDVYRVDVATLAVTRITSAPQDETCARYSADGARVVMLRNGDTTDDIVELDVASGVTREVTHAPAVRDGWPTYGPGGWTYYASMERGAFSIYRTRGGATEQLTHALDGEEDARPFVSADGSVMIYNKRHGGAIDIRALRLSS